MKLNLWKIALIVCAWATMLFLGWNSILSQTQAGLGLDDGFIHLCYAKNFLNGHLFQFNIGETSSGSTAPLWVIFETALGAIFGLLPSAWILSALSFLFSAFVVFALTNKVTRSLGKENSHLPILSSLAIITYGRFFWHTFSGMETQLYSAIAALSIGFYLTESIENKKFLWSAILAGIGLWLRPETFLLFVILIIGYIMVSIGKWKRLFLPFTIIAASVLLYFGINLIITGYIMPNTFFSKSALYRGTNWDYLTYTFSIFWKDNYPLLIASLMGAFWLIALAIYKRKYHFGVLSLWLLGLPFAKFIVSPQEAHFGRYTVIIVPVLVSVAFSLIAFIKKRWIQYAFASVILVANMITLPLWIKTVGKTIEQINTIHGETAKWINNNTNKDAYIATHDVGRIKFDTDRKILDLAGLTSNEATQLIWEKRKILPHSFIAFDSIAAKLILEHHPDFIVISPVWFPYLSANRSALQFLWRTYQYTDAVECVPEIAVFRALPNADTTIFRFERYGFHPDKQWTLGILTPQAMEIVYRLKMMSENERQDYTKFLIASNELKYPYLRISLRNILGDLIDWGNFDEAVIVSMLGCELYPDDPILWNVRGAVLSQMKEFDWASEAFARAVSLAPLAINYRVNYAITLVNANHTDIARAQLDTILTLDPHNLKANELRSEMEKSDKMK